MISHLFLLVFCVTFYNCLGAIKPRDIFTELNEYSDDEFVKERPDHVIIEPQLVYTLDDNRLLLKSTIFSTANIPHSEYEALQDFYTSLDGKWWDWEEDTDSWGIPWNFTQGDNPDVYNNPCVDNWQGIVCYCNDTTNSCNVQAIALNDYNLTGTIPDSVGTFSYLNLFDVGKNYIYSTLPASLGDLSLMSVFIVNLNHMIEGHIPHGLYNALNMTYFDVSDNIMSGSISAALGQWSQLMVLYFDHNHFTGQIPDSIGNLTKVTNMELEVNKFNGTIPASLGNLKLMSMMLLFSNKLTGTIPPELGGLESIVYFELYDNQLHGPIPSSICGLTAMKTLYLMKNQLTGPIPEDIGDLRNLLIFEVYTNHLTSTIPDSFYNLIHLQYLEIFANKLSGTISRDIGNFKNLTYFQANTNQFHGSLPDALMGLSKLLIIDVSYNHLTGGLPPIKSLRYMQYLMIYANQFTSVLPYTIETLVSLTHFVGYLNLIDGPIPPGIVYLQYLGYLDFHFNLLTGSIPDSFERLSRMTYLCLYGNRLTGPLHSSLSKLNSLQQLFINNNRFTGNLYSFYNATTQKYLTNIDLSLNQLTGTIPDSLFDLPGLATIALGTNCITGSLSDYMCTAETLSSLSLDGVNTAEQCVNFILPKSIRAYKTYSLTTKLRDIPRCLFNMPKLQTLHISGNGITGSLPADLEISSTLSDLALSHNELFGTIPQSIVLHRTASGAGWLNLDLSYNKLSGVIDKDFPPLLEGQQLSLQVNRLSGHIADSLLDGKDINILDGNIFTCESTGSEAQGLPAHDPTEPIYECGSNSCDQAIYVWMGIVGSILLLLLIVALSFWNVAAKNETDTTSDGLFGPLMRYLHSVAVYRKMCMAVFDVSFTPNQSHSILKFGTLLNHIRRVFVVLSLVILCILMPIYCVLTTYYNTYDYEYAWFVSAAFLGGTIPAYVLLGALTLFVLLIIFLYDRYLFPLESIHPEKYREATGMNPTEARHHSVLAMAGGMYSTVHRFVARRSRRFRYNMFVFTLILLNCAVVLVINGIYIYISITYNRTIVTITQFSFAVFKLFWNSVVVFDFYAKLKKTYFFEVDRATPSYRASLMTQGSGRSSRSTQRLEGKDILVQSFIVMFNNIASPCLAISVISTSCFYNAFFLPPEVLTEYSFLYCTNMILPSGMCTAWTPEVLETKYFPPFAYSYECSSVFVTTYTTVYIYMFIISCAMPVIVIGGKMMHQYLESGGSSLFKLIDKLLPPIVKPLKPLPTDSTAESLFGSDPADQSPLIGDPDARISISGNSLNSDILIEVGRMSKISSKHAQDSLVEANNLGQLFQTPKYMVSIVCNLGILITFGALFPPLAVVICVCTCVHTHYVQLLIGNVLVQATEAKPDGTLPFFHYSYRLDEECDGANRAFQSTVWLLLAFAASFYAFFLFDILGDSVGWRRALWAPLVMFCVPAAMYLLLWLFSKLKRKCCQRSTSGSASSSRTLRAESTYSALDENT